MVGGAIPELQSEKKWSVINCWWFDIWPLDLSNGYHWSADRPSGPMFNFYNIFEFNGPSNPQAKLKLRFSQQTHPPRRKGRFVCYFRQITERWFLKTHWDSGRVTFEGKSRREPDTFHRAGLDIRNNYYLVLDTFSKSSSERVQALPINLRYICKRVFH